MLKLSGFSTITVTALSSPAMRGSSAVPPQPGISPRNTSGSASAGAPVDTVRYVQCSATSRPPPIDAPLMNANDGNTEGGELAEHAVTEASDLEHLLVRRELTEDAEVGTNTEHEGLPGETHRDQVVACGDGVQRRFERGK